MAINFAGGQIVEGRMLDFLSYNIQAGIGTQRPRDYVMRAHRQLMSVRPKTNNLDNIADYIRPFDVVCLQEVDLGGFRSGYIDQGEYLKNRAGFPYMATQINRRLGRLSLHGNIILSRRSISDVESHLLPGSVTGRGLLISRIGHNNPIIIANTHFSLGEADQRQQFAFVKEKLSPFERVILAGDFNCTPQSAVLQEFDEGCVLDMVTEDYHHAFPSWNPNKAIDHIFVSKSFGPSTCEVEAVRYSDHLPLSMRIKT